MQNDEVLFTHSFIGYTIHLLYHSYSTTYCTWGHQAFELFGILAILATRIHAVTTVTVVKQGNREHKGLDSEHRQ